jgi:hypothetical protein
MAVVWAHCKTKTVCEPDESSEEGDGGENEEPEVKKGRGGCGHIQPQIRKEGLKLFVQYKKPKDDDDVDSCPPCVILTSSNLMDIGGEVPAARQEGHRTLQGVHSFQENG